MGGVEGKAPNEPGSFGGGAPLVKWSNLVQNPFQNIEHLLGRKEKFTRFLEYLTTISHKLKIAKLQNGLFISFRSSNNFLSQKLNLATLERQTLHVVN